MPFQITIKERIKPFSHTTWFRTVLPRTTCLVEIFPTALHIQEWHGSTYKTLFELTGPVKGFTVELDASRGELRVFGTAAQGAFSYRIFAEEGKVFIFLDKGPLPYPLKMKQAVLELNACREGSFVETLSLGSHRKQEWEQVVRRFDLAEIFPAWLKLGSLLPELEDRAPKKGGNYALLTACKEVVKLGDRRAVAAAFENLLAASFSGLLVPHQNDPRYLGLSTPAKALVSPLPLLKESAELIRGLFFREEKNTFKILPLLPPAFHAGRFIHIETKEGDILDFEWTKKALRRLILRPKASRRLRLDIPKPLKTYRLRTSRSDRGIRCAIGDEIELTAGQPLYLDRFEK